MSVNSKGIERFEKNLFLWWKNNRRSLPWRETRNPYQILVSEIMLQQTQVSRVIPKYELFLKNYPSVKRLAQAQRADVLRLWAGLGYNRRAVALHRAAQDIVRFHGGSVPGLFGQLITLPGIGSYTARATLVFSGLALAAPVDTNIQRIFWRHFGVPRKNLQSFANSLAARQEHPGDWSQMLMDFGALSCTSRSPQCSKLGLKHVRQDPVRAKKREAFKGSNRYWRGRIVEILRKSETTLPELRRHLRKETGEQILSPHLKRLLLDLERDGIIVRKRLLRLA